MAEDEVTIDLFESFESLVVSSNVRIVAEETDKLRRKIQIVRVKIKTRANVLKELETGILLQANERTYAHHRGNCLLCALRHDLT